MMPVSVAIEHRYYFVFKFKYFYKFWFKLLIFFEDFLLIGVVLRLNCRYIHLIINFVFLFFYLYVWSKYAIEISNLLTMCNWTILVKKYNISRANLCVYLF